MHAVSVQLSLIDQSEELAQIVLLGPASGSLVTNIKLERFVEKEAWLEILLVVVNSRDSSIDRSADEQCANKLAIIRNIQKGFMMPCMLL